MRFLTIISLFIVILSSCRPQSDVQEIRYQDRGKLIITHPASYYKKTDRVFFDVQVDKRAEFPGGSEKLNNYIKSHLKLSRNPGHNGGRMLLVFIVERNGKLSTFKVARGISNSFDKAAINVMRKCPKWTPAIINNEKVRMRGHVYIPF